MITNLGLLNDCVEVVVAYLQNCYIIRLERLNKVTKIRLEQPVSCQDLNTGPSECIAGAPTIERRQLACIS
jgi:hypothetical protein